MGERDVRAFAGRARGPEEGVRSAGGAAPPELRLLALRDWARDPTAVPLMSGIPVPVLPVRPLLRPPPGGAGGPEAAVCGADSMGACKTAWPGGGEVGV